MKSCGQFWVHAEPIGDKTQKIAATKIVPRRPKYLFMGSDSQQLKNALER
jgi:hypothetical protein